MCIHVYICMEKYIFKILILKLQRHVSVKWVVYLYLTELIPLYSGNCIIYMKNTGNPLVVTFKLVKLEQKSLFTSAKHKWLKAVLASNKNHIYLEYIFDKAFQKTYITFGNSSFLFSSFLFFFFAYIICLVSFFLVF